MINGTKSEIRDDMSQSSKATLLCNQWVTLARFLETGGVTVSSYFSSIAPPPSAPLCAKLRTRLNRVHRRTGNADHDWLP